MQVRTVDLLLWLASFAGNIGLFVVLIGRRRAQMFPVFTTFIAGAVFRTITLFWVQRYGSKAQYFYTYWMLAILVDVVLQLGIVLEIYFRIFRLHGRTPKDIRGHIVYWTIGSVVVAFFLTYLAAPDAKLAIQRKMIQGNFFSSALMSELFAGMVWLSVRQGLPMGTHVARICEGLGVYSLIDVLIEAAHTYFGLRHGDVAYIRLSHLRIVIYLICLGYWIATLWRNTSAPPESTDRVRTDLGQIGRLAEANLAAARSRRSQ